MDHPVNELAEQLRDLLAEAIELVKADDGCIIVANHDTGALVDFAGYFPANHPAGFQRVVRAALFKYVIDKGSLCYWSYDMIGVNIDNFNLNHAVRPTTSMTIRLNYKNAFLGMLYLEKYLGSGRPMYLPVDMQNVENLAAQKNLFQDAGTTSQDN